MLRSELCQLLGITYPVLQGGMAWIADGVLAAAVSNGGGLGIIAAGNAPQDYVREQIRIAKEVMHSRRLSGDIHKLVKGVMIESYLEEGCQKVGGGVYGKSITDPCLGWEDTQRLIYELAEYE